MKVIRDGFIYLIGDLISKSVPFLLLPILSRFLGPNGYGELSYYQVIIALCVIIVGFSFDGALTRYYYKYGHRALGLLIFIGAAHTLLLGFIIIVISMILEKNTILIYALLTGVSQSILAIFFAAQQCQKKTNTYAFIQIINALLSGGGTYLLLTFVEHSAEMRVIAMLIANVISLIISVVIVYIIQGNTILIKKNKTTSLYKYNISFGMPLLLHQLSFFAKGQADRLLIFNIFNTSVLGVYSAGYQLASVLAILLMSLNKAVIPYYFDSIKKGIIGSQKIRRWSLQSLCLVPIPGFIAWLIPNEWYLLFLGQTFNDVKYYCVFFTFAISITIPYLILVNFLFYLSKNTIISFCTVSSSVIYLGLVYLFSHVSIKLVPFAMVISNLISIALLYFAVFKVQQNIIE
ncbi:oligosaccharide flippase family protein [Enterobacteriaceae bacterium LUAb1]